jgi:hypothetical protein
MLAGQALGSGSCRCQMGDRHLFSSHGGLAPQGSEIYSDTLSYLPLIISVSPSAPTRQSVQV